MNFEQPTLFIQKGDIITSKKGILQESPISNDAYLITKQEYLGNGVWRVIGDKTKVNITSKSNK